MNESQVKKFLKNWTLPFSMVAGVLYYLAFSRIPALSEYKDSVDGTMNAIVPVLMFLMLTLSFTNVSPRDIGFRRWHLSHVLFQITVSSLLLFLLVPIDKQLAAAAFICFSCPTAVASSVITDKLRGNVSSLVSYTLIVNCVVSLFIPLMLPFINPVSGLSFMELFLKILLKVFPLLVFPILLVWFLRYFMPKLHAAAFRIRGISFYLWAFSLVLLISQTMGELLSDGRVSPKETAIFAISLGSCLLQFLFGKLHGRKAGDSISSGQALGQKNTIFAIWIACAFVDQTVALAPGAYVIWQNVVNSAELYFSKKAGSVS